MNVTTASAYRNELRQGATHEAWQAGAHRRLNVGAGQYPLCYFTNLDESPDAIADICAHVPPLPLNDASLDEIWACHFLEHLERPEQHQFLDECHRCLTVGGRLGLVVPDFRAVMVRYDDGEKTHDEVAPGIFLNADNLDSICEVVIYSIIQPSQHRWCFDAFTLKRLVQTHGFRMTGEIDRYTDPRLGSGAWYQTGADFVKV